MPKDIHRIRAVLISFKRLKESLHLSVEQVHTDLNTNFLPETDQVDLSTIYRWLRGTAPRGEALLALQEWISVKTNEQTNTRI